uniref:Type I restriction-modification system, specificity subunit S (EC) n=1 Tax=uncultured Thiotrichaceae bacterium TaxID=298394 RepID=A0A6S6U9F1_9GAMM|nr:MAG: Type I restriction-modification system, specificity subunit S (EC [uncultured Thiotrichaceae bacterium]
MESEWQKTTLKSLGVSLIDCVHKTPPAAEQGIPYIAIPQLKEGMIDFSAKPRLISYEHYLEWTKKASPEANDIVLSRRCNPGETAYVPAGTTFALGQNLVLLRSDGKDLFPPFLRWLVRGYEWWGEVDKYLNAGAVFDSLRCADIPKFELSIPPIHEQKAIAHILGSLDDKIELNRQINTTLESMAQTLFKSWFVDFNPVLDNALAAGNPIPDTLAERAATRKALGDVRKSLPEDIRQLFPAAFVWTEEAGWIPEGWKVIPTSGALIINPKTTLKKGETASFVDMKALPTSGFAISNIIQKKYSGGAKFKNHDVLFARITPCLENGKTGVVDFLRLNEVGFGSTEFIVMRGKAEIKMPFIACLARNETFRQHAIQHMVGSSGRQRVQNACFDSFHLCLPSTEKIMETFNGLTQSSFDRMTKAQSESNNLEKLRDTLLPKLLSGELRIPEAEKLVEEAL